MKVKGIKRTSAHKNSWPEHWPEWVRGICWELELIEETFPSTLLDKVPSWVDKLSHKVIQYMYPGMQINKQLPGAEFLGYTMGQLTWLLESKQGLAHMMDKYEQAAEKLDAEIREKMGEEQYAALTQELKSSDTQKKASRLIRSFLLVLAKKRHLLRKTLHEAPNQPLEIQSQFYGAYATAITEHPIDENGMFVREKSPGAGAIYLLMILNWRKIQNMGSISDLHAFLCDVFGSSLIGEKERVRKMCNRLSLKLATAGRPAHSQEK